MVTVLSRVPWRWVKRPSPRSCGCAHERRRLGVDEGQEDRAERPPHQVVLIGVVERLEQGRVVKGHRGNAAPAGMVDLQCRLDVALLQEPMRAGALHRLLPAVDTKFAVDRAAMGLGGVQGDE